MVGVLHYGTGAVGCHTQLEVALLGSFDVLDLKERPGTFSSLSQLQLLQGLYFSPSTTDAKCHCARNQNGRDGRGRQEEELNQLCVHKCRWAAKCPNFDDSNGNKYSDWA